ncbi:Gfo/Idh/MocA family oxidoreductase [Candidatus Daviesbacteria bacterium]|nr:Gfo/Idh/MocA family oxidoreductase [Candidatus Daviesbacteria bacterium]
MVNKLKDIKPLIIGIGIAGKRHLEAQLNLGIKTGVYTTNPQTSQSLKKQKNVIVFNNLQDGLDWSNLVHVCTPDDKHTEFVATALKKGRAVLCEKSFTTNFQDALKLQKLAYKYNCLLVVGQNYRLTPTFAETRKRILEGQIGAVTNIETTYYHDKNEYQQRYQDKYFLYIGGSHAVDLACWVIGEQIISIQAVSENELNYQISVKFSSGVLANIRLDASSPQSRNGSDLKVFGTEGKLVSHNKLDKLVFYERGNRKPQLSKFPNIKTYTIALEVKIIDDYLLGRRNSYWPLPNVDEAINTMKILDTVGKAIS